MTFRDEEYDDPEPPRAPKPWEISPSEDIARRNAAETGRGAGRAAGRAASAAGDAAPGGGGDPGPEPTPTPGPTRPRSPGPATPRDPDPEEPPFTPPSGLLAMTAARQIRAPRKLDADTSPDARVRWAAAALSQGCFPAAVMVALMEQCQIAEKTAKNDLTRARRFLAEALAPSLAVLRLESLAFYSVIAADPVHDAKVRLQARKRIDELYGLDSPRRVAVEIGQIDNADDHELRQKAIEAALDSMDIDDLEALHALHERLNVIESTADAVPADSAAGDAPSSAGVTIEPTDDP